jgi:hypothetical protein
LPIADCELRIEGDATPFSLQRAAGPPMALINRLTRCPLCDELLGDRDIVATTHFIADRDDPLWRFSDAAMHADCFRKWSLREQFVSKYNDCMGRRAMRSNGKLRP